MHNLPPGKSSNVVNTVRSDQRLTIATDSGSGYLVSTDGDLVTMRQLGAGTVFNRNSKEDMVHTPTQSAAGDTHVIIAGPDGLHALTMAKPRYEEGMEVVVARPTGPLENTRDILFWTSIDAVSAVK